MSTISSALSPFDFTRVKPNKSKTDDPKDPNDTSASAAPSADLMRMIQGLMAGKETKKTSPTGNDPQALFAPVTVNGKIVATLTNGGDSDPADPRGQLVKLDAASDATQKSSADLAAAAGGRTAKGSGALTQTEGTALRADAPADPRWDAVLREKQTSYSGLRERTMIADPSMLVQAQLFAQQTEAANAPQIATRVPVRGDTMSTAGAAA